jgi:hypothetical protein
MLSVGYTICATRPVRGGNDIAGLATRFVSVTKVHAAEYFLKDPQLIKKFPLHFVEPEGSLPCSQECATCPCPEPTHSSPRPLWATFQTICATPPSGGPLVGCPWLLIQYTNSQLPPIPAGRLLHLQPDGAPCRGVRC